MIPDNQGDEFEDRVVGKVQAKVNQPVLDVLRGLAMGAVFCFVVMVVIMTGLGILVTEQARSRGKTITKINQEIAAIHQQEADTRSAAQQAQAAAENARTDLSNVVKQYANQPTPPALLHAYAEITCIAHQAYPCP